MFIARTKWPEGAPVVAGSPGRRRRSLVWKLLATTCVASLLGACSQTAKGPFSAASSPSASLAAAPGEARANEAAAVVAQWSEAYARSPQDPKIALGYGRALRAVGARDRAFQVLQAATQAHPQDGQLAAELGRLAVDGGNLELAQQAFNVAEAKGVRDWRTLSAQGTMHAKQGEHARAQQFYLAALQQQPDAVSVMNNLALSYALDGKPEKAEGLLRNASQSGHDNRRVRQNLALVLGLQGKFQEAKTVASTDLTEAQAKAQVAYLRNMTSKPTRMAMLDDTEPPDSNWEPFATDPLGPSEKPERVAELAREVETVLQAPKQTAKPPEPEAKVRSAAAPPQASTPARAPLAAEPEEVLAPLATEPAEPVSTPPAPEPVQEAQATPERVVAEPAEEAISRSSTHGKSKPGSAKAAEAKSPALVTPASFVSPATLDQSATKANQVEQATSLLRETVD